MFDNKRYTTKEIQQEIPLVLQILLWSCIDTLRLNGKELDYLQVFELSVETKNGKIYQKVEHRQEIPRYKKMYVIPFDDVAVGKIFVIDDGFHSTMMLSSEY